MNELNIGIRNENEYILIQLPSVIALAFFLLDTPSVNSSYTHVFDWFCSFFSVLMCEVYFLLCQSRQIFL